MSGLASRLHERVRIEQAQEEIDEFGGVTIEWEELATVWAEVRPLSGTAREHEVAAQPTAVAGYRVIMRVRDDVHAGMRLVWKGRTLSIASLHEESETLTLLAYEEGI